jgi:hypothetical protein
MSKHVLNVFTAIPMPTLAFDRPPIMREIVNNVKFVEIDHIYNSY